MQVFCSVLVAACSGGWNRGRRAWGSASMACHFAAKRPQASWRGYVMKVQPAAVSLAQHIPELASPQNGRKKQLTSAAVLSAAAAPSAAAAAAAATAAAQGGNCGRRLATFR